MRSAEELLYNKYLNRACLEVAGFSELRQRFQRNISFPGPLQRSFANYCRHVAVITLHFHCLPTELAKDYLYQLQQRSHTPSHTYFKHTVYGLRFLLKAEGLPYGHRHLPVIAKSYKLPLILSRQEIRTGVRPACKS